MADLALLFENGDTERRAEVGKRRKMAKLRTPLPLVWMLTVPSFLGCYCAGVTKDRLEAGSILAMNDRLVSANNTFVAGFFNFSKSNRNYLGVSYADSLQEHVWVGNRDQPAMDGSVLKFSLDGNLEIMDPDKKVVWTSSTGGTNASTVVIENSGNLVLRHSSGGIVWQSFDHPSHTYMPGQKFYVGSNITCFSSAFDPSPGRFSLQLHLPLEFISVRNPNVSYWNTGVYNGAYFLGVPEMAIDNSLYNFSIKNDSGRVYFVWEENSKLRSHFSLDYDGVIGVRIWDSANKQWFTIASLPTDPCQVDHLCGQNGICNGDNTVLCQCPVGFTPANQSRWSDRDWSLGCVSELPLSCNSSTFSILTNTSFDHGVATNTTDLEGCKQACSEDCKCVGFSYDDNTLVPLSCMLHYGSLFNGKTSPTIVTQFYLRVSNSPELTLKSKGGRHSRKTIWILTFSLTGAISLLLLAFISFWIFVFRHRSRISRSWQGIDGMLIKFSYKDLQTATGNFSQKLGSGGFGTVYKGTLQDQSTVAIKKLHNIKQGDKDFRAEVNTIGIIQHVNLVRLLGFCAEDTHRLLVYEYMPKESLDSYLFSQHDDNPQQTVLDWKTRYAIATGTARGIAYLHEECRSRIIHCDIKPENILLDADFNAKVSDFGMAKLMGREFSRVITTLRGTRGYLAPEWLSGFPITAKADVYSYGMTLLEIISGRRNISNDLSNNTNSNSTCFFPLFASQQAEMGDFASLADERLAQKLDPMELKTAVLVAIWCIQDEETERPSMSRVVQMLEGIVKVGHPPTPSSLLILQEPSHTTANMPNSEVRRFLGLDGLSSIASSVEDDADHHHINKQLATF